MFDLARLLEPISSDVFAREYWERKPLLVQRDDPTYYAPLLTLADVDDILSTSSAHSGQLQVVRDGKERPLAKNTSGLGGTFAEAWYDEYRSGSTIVLQALHERWPPLRRLCQALAAEFSSGFQVNVYVTPPGAQGLSTHFDTHDVFVVQIAGSKGWRVFDRTIELPLYGQAHEGGTPDPATLLHDIRLTAGSVLYLPRGYPHDATSTDTVSVHLAVGALTVTWASTILSAVEHAIDADSRYRASLPPAFADGGEPRRRAEAHLAALLRDLVDRMDPAAIIEDAARRVEHALPIDLTGHLLDLEHETRLDLQVPLRVRAESRPTLVPENGTVAVQFHGKRVTMPAHAKPLLEFMLTHEQFKGSDLPDAVDDAGKLVVVRRLLREGFLTRG